MAGFWRRVLAVILDWLMVTLIHLLIDAILFGLIYGIMVLIEPAISTRNMVFIITYLVLSVLNLHISWLWYALFHSSRYQATPGKMALGIKVTNKAGERISFERATARFFSKYITALTLGVGYVMAAFSSRKQALHDFIASTLVVNRYDAFIMKKEYEERDHFFY